MNSYNLRSDRVIEDFFAEDHADKLLHVHCAYCINCRSNDIPRATLPVTELVNLTIEFYRRNYIEGLFLSSRKIWISQQDWKSYQAERRVPLRSKTEKEHATTNNDKRRVSETGEPGD